MLWCTSGSARLAAVGLDEIDLARAAVGCGRNHSGAAHRPCSNGTLALTSARK